MKLKNSLTQLFGYMWVPLITLPLIKIFKGGYYYDETLLISSFIILMIIFEKLLINIGVIEDSSSNFLEKYQSKKTKYFSFLFLTMFFINFFMFFFEINHLFECKCNSPERFIAGIISILMGISLLIVKFDVRK